MCGEEEFFLSKSWIEGQTAFTGGKYCTYFYGKLRVEGK